MVVRFEQAGGPDQPLQQSRQLVVREVRRYSCVVQLFDLALLKRVVTHNYRELSDGP